MATKTHPNSGCQPLIIIAAPHSGGDLLAQLLCQLPGFATCSSDVSNSIWKVSQAALNHDELAFESASQDISRYLQRHFDRTAKSTKSRYVVDITTANSLRVDFVQRVLPTARFLFVVRDGRDVLAQTPTHPAAARRARLGQTPTADLPHYIAEAFKSKLAALIPRRRRPVPNGPQFRGMQAYVRRFGYEAAVAKQWATCVSRAAEAFEEITDAGLSTWGDNVVMPLQYESLVEEPVDELWDICDFLGYEVTEEQLESACDSVSLDGVGAWQQPGMQERLETVAETLNPVLVEFGYSPIIPAAQTSERRAA